MGPSHEKLQEQQQKLLKLRDQQATHQERLLHMERSQRAKEEDRRSSLEADAKDAISEAKRAKRRRR